MIDDDKNKQPAAGQNQQKETAPVSEQREQGVDDDQHSYPGKLDQVEGSMHNGEIGGGIRKEEE
ncbi:MAG TPA: hypothetical protein VER36_10355 [Flavisolibacter sp.]|nr:hypothetical protein [Flavisolibacter sp.]